MAGCSHAHPAPSCSYRTPPGATPPKAAPERKFEGIKLEGGGPSVPVGTVSSLTICEACFRDEETRTLTGQQLRLPAGVSTAELAMEKLEEMIQWDRDPDGDMESEFFETRQVGVAAGVPGGGVRLRAATLWVVAKR